MFTNLNVDLSDDPNIATDLNAVVRSAIEEFTKIYPESPPAGIRPIHVIYQQEGPLIDSATDTNVYIICLTVNNRCYDKLVYQLGHELCHIFADPRRSNWFVECVCELASQVLLHRMSTAWTDNSPFPNWISYAPNFRQYLQDWILEVANTVFGTDSLPDQDKLHWWLTSVYHSLKDNPSDRYRNAVIAVMLRPLFEESVDNWGAVRFLGQASVPPPINLRDLNLNSDFEFNRWEEVVPEHSKGLVRRVRRLFINNAI